MKHFATFYLFGREVQIEDANTIRNLSETIAQRTIIETLDVSPKMKRLSQWCEDVNKLAQDIKCDFIYVDQDRFEKYRPSNFSDLIKQFREYKSS